MHVINYSRDSEESGLDTGYKWLAGLVSGVCMARLVFRVCRGGVGVGVQILRDRNQNWKDWLIL